MNRRILFVDDELNILYAYKRNLRSYFEVETASNGKDAIDKIMTQEPFAVVISDYRMPEMDGIELLHKVREISPDTVRIILTGYADLQTAIDAINEGNIYRFLTKPIPNDKLVAALNDSIELNRLVTTEKELNRKLNDAYSTIKQDLETAADLQRQFLPENNVEIGECSFNWMYLPSVFVSGDTFNFFPLSEDAIAFYCADVSGHGVPAAFLSVSLSRTLGIGLRNQLLVNPNNYNEIYPPSLVIKKLNEQFLSTGDNSEYFTMIYGIIDLKNNSISFSQAGHPNPIYIKSGEQAIYLVSRGFPVGILPEAEYYDQTIPFHKGDKFVIFTDGITECAGVKKKTQAATMLLDFFNNHVSLDAAQILEALPKIMKTWTQGEDFYDDITMLLIERK